MQTPMLPVLMTDQPSETLPDQARIQMRPFTSCDDLIPGFREPLALRFPSKDRCSKAIKVSGERVKRVDGAKTGSHSFYRRLIPAE
jgi:hypothetical protein